MNSRLRQRWLWLFLAINALSLLAGALVERPEQLDLSCRGRAAQTLPGTEQQWLLHRYDLDLRRDGQGDYKARLRLLDTSNGQALGYLHRAARFDYRRQGQRLLLHVRHSGKSDTSNLGEQQLRGLGLFVFNEQLRLSYHLRQLAPGTLLISNGQGGVLLCSQSSPRH
ncbi:MAG TPA: hypothetical protein VLC30_08635 [Pseudomonas sp.]|nr:hypothetical protein [Pseudomonas sp.]